MTFECNGVRYTSDRLLAYATGDARTPLLYMTRDHAHFFVVTMDRWAGIRVSESATRDVAGIAARFGIVDGRLALL